MLNRWFRLLLHSFLLFIATFVWLTTAAWPAAAQPSSRPLVVPNRVSRDVSLIDSTTLLEIARLPVSHSPHLAVVSANDQVAYVATERDPQSGTSSLIKIQLATRSVVAAQSYTTASIFVRLAITPDGERLLVVDRERATLYVLRTADLSLVYTRQLCQSCDGVLAPLYSAPQVAITPDSTTAHFSVPVDATLRSLDLATGTITATHPLVAPGSSTAFSSLVLFDIAPSIPIATHPFFGVKAVDVLSGWTLPLQLTPAGVTSAETVPLRLGADLLLIQGESTYDAQPDALRLYHVNSGGTLSYPTSEASYVPLFNPLRFEVWSVCRSIPALQQCDPVRIDATNLLAPSQSVTILGPAASTGGVPRFSADFGRYFYPMTALQQVLVIDTATKAPLTMVPVGQGPVGVY